MIGPFPLVIDQNPLPPVKNWYIPARNRPIFRSACLILVHSFVYCTKKAYAAQEFGPFLELVRRKDRNAINLFTSSLTSQKSLVKKSANLENHYFSLF
jgi:hypothetical protein